MPALRAIAKPPVIGANDKIRNERVATRHNADQASRMIKGVKGEMYGLEMEVYCPEGYTNIVPIVNKGESKYFIDMEPDASLCRTRGIELITRGPVPVDDLLKDEGWLNTWLTKISDSKTVKQGKQPSGYGLHINVNCAGWGWTAKQAFCAAIVLMPDVNKKAAGRSTGGSSFNVQCGTSEHSWGYLPRPSGYTTRDSNCYVRVDKGNNIDCMEVRMFQMNTDFSVMKDYITHLQEIRKFSKKYKTILLYLAAATCPVNDYRGYISYDKINKYLYTLWEQRGTLTAAKAVALLPPLDRPFVNRGDFFSAIFDPQKTFVQRKAALYDAWHSPEPADQARSRSS